MGMIGHYLRITPTELAALEAAPETVVAFIYRDDTSERHLDIDKAWHAIHFLLNQDQYQAHELLNIVFGGEALGNADLGTGPARAIPAAEVAAMATVVRSIGVDELRARWDPVELQEHDIYPEIWDDGDDALNYVLDNYARLVDFFVAAARDDDAIITYIA